MKITCPAPGSLIVLDDQLNIEMTCLMPSIFAPSTKMRDKSIVLPTASEDSRTTAFHIARPEGLHRLYAIWSAAPIDIESLGSCAEYDGPSTICEEALASFVEALAAAYGRDPDGMAVGAEDYRVI